MPLSRAQLMKQQKSVKKIEQHKQADAKEEDHAEAQIKQLPQIPQDAFRNPTYIYQEQVAHKHLNYKIDEEASDEIVGYLTQPLEAPGYEDFKLESKNYPRVTLAQLPSYKYRVPPIVVLYNEQEVLAFLPIAKINKQPLYDMACAAFAAGKNVWFLPNKSAIAAEKDCESFGEMIRSAEKQYQQKLAEEQHQKESESQTQLPKVKKAMLWIFSIFVLVVCVIFAIQTKYFDHVITQDNKLVDIAGLYETMGLKPGAKKGEIKKQYRKLAVQYHPDRNPDCETCAETFDKITAAYKKLVPGDAFIPTGFDADAAYVVKLRK